MVLELSGRQGARGFTCYKDGGSTEGVQEDAALFPANKIKVHVSAPTGGGGPVITRNYSPSGLICSLTETKTAP